MATTASPPPLDLHAAHPLEVIPWFRRWPCNPWRDLVYTFIYNALLAVGFSLLALLWTRKYAPLELLWLNFVFAQSVGYSLHLLYVILEALIPRARRREPWALLLFWGLLPIAGVMIGYAVAATLLGWADYRAAMFTPRGVALMAILALAVTGIMLAMIVPRARAAQAEAAMALEQARVAAAEREATLARMKALQAQVEPHFLYNTLAHVTSLIGSEPAQARAMLDRLIALLRATAQTSNGDTTLRSQADLVHAYLDILSMRMGPRLKWTIDVPAELANVALPPSLLQPIVENAVKHGLEPKIEGGAISLTAKARDGVLELVVTDTGAGFRTEASPIGGSTNLGLAVLKERLSLLYGDAASLVLVENRPTGVKATLRIPLVHEH